MANLIDLTGTLIANSDPAHWAFRCQACGMEFTLPRGVARNHACKGEPQKIERTNGVGSILHGMLSKVGINPKDCACEQHIKEMDENGPDWCEHNLDTVVEWLRVSAAERGLPFVAFIARRIVQRAIRLHRKGIHVAKKPCRNCVKKKEENMIEGSLTEEHLESFFQKVFVINLDRRADRWAEFTEGLPKDWPFVAPTRVSAVDGKDFGTPPSFWTAGSGAWGCYRSHVRILEQCLAEGIESVLILEDDAVFSPTFTEDVKEYLAHVPMDWEMLYLGGQHLKAMVREPLAVNEFIDQPYNVNRTHAFAVRGKSFMQKLYRHLHDWENWRRKHHIDHHLGRLVQKQEDQIYSTGKWLVGQREGKSNISGKNFSNARFWVPGSAKSLMGNTTDLPFVAVLGLHSSGSSCLAGVLHHLGLYLGKHLTGFYGSNPEGSCGFEAKGLMKLCESMFSFTETLKKKTQAERTRKLRAWIKKCCYEAQGKGKLAAGKYPHLCQLGRELESACGKGLKVITIDRPLELSVKSLQKRSGLGSDTRNKLLAEHQHWLATGKEQIAGKMASDRLLRISYEELLKDSETQIKKIIRFLGIVPTPDQISRAVLSVDPARCHVQAKE